MPKRLLVCLLFILWIPHSLLHGKQQEEGIQMTVEEALAQGRLKEIEEKPCLQGSGGARDTFTGWHNSYKGYNI